MSDPPFPEFKGSALREFLDVLHEGIIVVDDDTRVVYANRAALQMFRRTEEEILGNLSGEAIRCLHSEDHGCGKSTWCPCGLNDGILEIIGGVERALGETLSIPIRMGDTVEVKNFKINFLGLPAGEEEESLKVCIYFKDVSQLVLQTDELRLSQGKVERRAVQCESMTEMLLQDIRAPLRRQLKSFREGPDGEALETSGHGSPIFDLETLALSVENLLLVSQMDPEGLPVSKEILDPCEFVSETVEDLRAGVSPDAVTLEFRPPPGEALAISADRKLLRMVLDNLLRNAVTQSPPGGTVLIEIVSRLPKEVEIAVIHRGKHLPEEHLENVFDPFFHLERPEGLGRRNRGLAFCRIAAQAQGGDLRAQNLEEGGVALRLTLSARRRTTETDEKAHS